ncbi:hypothetical protein MKX03_010731 [Papaver bracteatum]|nr:hypothetical protein MKX03_010731 [Papaver bracteatum]
MQELFIKSCPLLSKKKNKKIFTCEICVELVPLNTKFKNIDIRCSHNYCTECIAKYIQVKVTQDNTVVLDTLSCRSFLSEKVFEKWCRVHCESSVLLESSKCGFSYPISRLLGMILNECLFCFHCMVPWNEKHRCTDRSETIIDIDSNDVLFMENVKHNKWVRCPSCYHFVERNQGCSSMTCRCKTAFCYNCGEKACKCKNILCWWQCLILTMYFVVLSPLFVLAGEVLR